MREEKKKEKFSFYDEEKFMKMEMRMMKFNSVEVWLALLYFSSEGLVFLFYTYRTFYRDPNFHQFHYLCENIDSKNF